MLAPMPIRVVLADDSDDVREMLRMALEMDGRFDIVGEAGNGEEAVSMVSEQRPDAIFLDLVMPVLDGLKAIPRIRDSSPETKIVVLSVAAAHPSSSEAMELGATAMVQKGGAQTARELAAEVAELFAEGRGLGLA
jgi:DNA-binding NarL/FixJ family response regulator